MINVYVNALTTAIDDYIKCSDEFTCHSPSNYLALHDIRDLAVQICKLHVSPLMRPLFIVSDAYDTIYGRHYNKHYCTDPVFQRMLTAITNLRKELIAFNVFNCGELKTADWMVDAQLSYLSKQYMLKCKNVLLVAKNT